MHFPWKLASNIYRAFNASLIIITLSSSSHVQEVILCSYVLLPTRVESGLSPPCDGGGLDQEEDKEVDKEVDLEEVDEDSGGGS